MLRPLLVVHSPRESTRHPQLTVLKRFISLVLWNTFTFYKKNTFQLINQYLRYNWYLLSHDSSGRERCAMGKAYVQLSGGPWFKPRWTHYRSICWFTTDSSPRDIMSFTRDVKLELPCTGSVPDTLKSLHCLIEKRRGNRDSIKLWTFFGKVRLYSNMMDAFTHTEIALNFTANSLLMSDFDRLTLI